jgi:mannose-1-phosphate guanylyltransferase
MFVWTTDAILHEIETHLPGHHRALKKAARFDRTPQWPTALKRAFASLQTISIDYAVMEKAAKVLCVASSFSWKDVGGWPALRSYLPQDEDGNAFRGHVLTLDAQGNLIFCEDPDETIMLVGVDDLIAVRAGQKTLIVHKDKAEEIKGLVPKIQKS